MEWRKNRNMTILYTFTDLKQGHGFESDQTRPNQRQGAGSEKDPLR